LTTSTKGKRKGKRRRKRKRQTGLNEMFESDTHTDKIRKGRGRLNLKEREKDGKEDQKWKLG
jgi:hypothetical protein